jgi:preprotein translocase subunit SecG
VYIGSSQESSLFQNLGRGPAAFLQKIPAAFINGFIFHSRIVSFCRDEKERKRDRIHDKQKREKDEVNAAQHRHRNARDEKFQADNQLRKLQDAEKQKAETSALITNLETEIQVIQIGSLMVIIAGILEAWAGTLQASRLELCSMLLRLQASQGYLKKNFWHTRLITVSSTVSRSE